VTASGVAPQRSPGHRRRPPQPADTLMDRPPRRTMRIAFLISRLDYGGTERQLLMLSQGLRERGHSVVVLVYRPGGALEPEIRAAGVRIRVLEKRGRWDFAGFLVRLHRILREEQPDVLHGYLGVPNVMAVPFRLAVGGPRIVWGERASRIDRRHHDLSARFVGVAARALSRAPNLVIVNSRAGFEHAAAKGYPRDRMTVIPNGFDITRFAPDRAAGRTWRHAWNVDDATLLVGYVARMHPVKDHRTFLAGAALLAKRRADVRFACVGGGDPSYRRKLQDFACEHGLTDQVLWVDAQADMPRVYNALDLACSASSSEGFPNTVGEAMACGVPCVVTDVGDSAWLLGQPSLVVPPGDAVALGERIGALLDDRARLAQLRVEVRERIVSNFSISRLVTATEDALTALLEGTSR